MRPSLCAVGNPDLGVVTTNSESGETSLTLSLIEHGNGTVITSTRSLLYGNVTAQIKSVAGAGILTSFALVSGTGDEIDFECVVSPRARPSFCADSFSCRFTTNSSDLAQSAYFYRGDVDDCACFSSNNLTFSSWPD